MPSKPDITEQRQWPTVIEAGVLAKNGHVSDAQIVTDIADTEAEIAQYERLMKAEQEIAKTSPSEMDRRMAEFKAGARPQQIAERQAFVDFLKRLQAARAAAAGVQ
jgi:hypothetical protein